MSWRIVYDMTPCRCCARCGNTPAEVKRLGLECYAYGHHYYAHQWINWRPDLSVFAPDGAIIAK